MSKSNLKTISKNKGMINLTPVKKGSIKKINIGIPISMYELQIQRISISYCI